MTGSQNTSDLPSVASIASFDSMPEDIALQVVSAIKLWVKGSQEDRERGRRERDSTFRAASMVNRSSLRFFGPFVLEEFSVANATVLAFYEALEKGGTGLGCQIRSIRFVFGRKLTDEAYEALTSQVLTLSTLSPSEAFYDRCVGGMQVLAQRLYARLSNLESLIVCNRFFPFASLQHNVSGQLRPHAFLSRSLKKLKLEFEPHEEGYTNLNPNGRNAIWILIFCSHLQEACLGIEMSVCDLAFLSDFSTAYESMRSVKKLALKIDFVYTEQDRRTWWGLQAEQEGEIWKENKKTQSLAHLLRSTHQLEALETIVVHVQRRSGDESNLSYRLLTTLSSSFGSLKHLRLLGEFERFDDAFLDLTRSNFLHSFEAVRVITLDENLLNIAALVGLPPNAEILYVPYQYPRPSTSSEYELLDSTEIWLIELLLSLNLPQLKEVVVTSGPLSVTGDAPESAEVILGWEKSREQLRELEIFTSGRVKLREIEVGETGECSNHGGV